MNTGALKRGLVFSIVLTIWLRLILFFVGFNLLTRFPQLPITTRQMELTEYIPTEPAKNWYSIIQPLHRFDALWYESIAIENFKNTPLSTSFFPLYPWTVRLFSTILLLTFPQTAFIINTLLTVLIFYLLYYLCLLETTSDNALRSVLIYSLFPTSFFLLVPYAEPLLFVFLLLALIFMKRGNFWGTVVTGSLAALVKPYGVAIIIPAAFHFLKDKKFQPKLKLLFLLLIPVSFFMVMLYQDKITGIVASTVVTQMAWRQRRSLGDVDPLTLLFRNLVVLVRSYTDLPNLLNLTSLAGILLFFYKKWQSIDITYRIFLITYFFIFCFNTYTTQFYSLSRFILVLFPVFIFAGKQKWHPLYLGIYLSTSFGLYIVFFMFYTLGFFVA